MGEEDKQDWAQCTSLGHTGVMVEVGNFLTCQTGSDGQEVQCPVADSRGQAEVVKFGDQVAEEDHAQA